MKRPNTGAALTRCIVAAALATTLSGCMVSGPLSLLSATDRLFLQSDSDAAPSARPISVRQMLANARQGSADSSAEEHSPVATIERGPAGMDGPAYSALGDFLSSIAPLPENAVVITRPPAKKAASLEDARFAIRVGRLIEEAGHKVRFATSPVQENGALFLSVAQGD